MDMEATLDRAEKPVPVRSTLRESAVVARVTGLGACQNKR
jgi:hypothetical protein